MTLSFNYKCNFYHNQTTTAIPIDGLMWVGYFIWTLAGFKFKLTEIDTLAADNDWQIKLLSSKHIFKLDNLIITDDTADDFQNVWN